MPGWKPVLRGECGSRTMPFCTLVCAQKVTPGRPIRRYRSPPLPIPKVSIVGRPNVGKSSIFNWLTGQRIAIVDPTAGVTRDRISFLFEHDGRYLELTDTGGMG